MRAAAEAVQIGLAREMLELRTEVSMRAPSSEQEAKLLSEGIVQNIAGGNVFSGGYVGTPDGGRFQRLGDQIPIREAIYTEPIRTSRSFDKLMAGIGNPEWINARTGFSWDTRKRGVQGPTFPFNRAYVQTLENGGASWVVVPRPDNVAARGLPGALEPEDGLLTRKMVKTLQPRRMYASALVARRGTVSRNIFEAVKKAVRELR